MADDLRSSQVTKLTTSPPLPAELTDAVLDASDEERAAAAAELADRTREWLESIGALKPSASVLDLDYRRMIVLAGVYETVERWWRFPPYQQHSLQTMLKIIPADHARWVEWLLRWGGFLPQADPAEGPRDPRRGGSNREGLRRSACARPYPLEANQGRPPEMPAPRPSRAHRGAWLLGWFASYFGCSSSGGSFSADLL
jgi:hypothetical protein